MTIGNKLFNKAYRIGRRARIAIRKLLKKYGIETLSTLPYMNNGYMSNYTFHGVDKDGYGIAYILTLVEVNNGRIIFTWEDNEFEYEENLELTELTYYESLSTLLMLEELFVNIKKYNLPILKKGEDYLDEHI